MKNISPNIQKSQHLYYKLNLDTLLEVKAYEPVRVIFSQDWSHIYPWAQLTS